MYTVADDVLKCAIWHKAQHHSREMIESCLFWGLYENKYKESIPLALIWSNNEVIDSELARQAKEIANKIYGGIE